MPLLEVQDLRTYFHTRDGVLRAVDGISFDVNKKETVGIVGESGSGKSVACYSLLRLIPQPPGKIEGGKALFNRKDLLQLGSDEIRSIRGREIGMIFQDPMTSLNPYMTIGAQLIEPLRIHKGEPKSVALEKAAKELDAVGIKNAKGRLNSYPHEFSGGMRQRVMIAMAMIVRPKIIIADEPTTALDVTVQRQVLDLIRTRQEDLGTAVIFITHDLAVVSEICDRVNVMYAGRFVEQASVQNIFQNPRHPYTRALQKSIPALQEKGKDLFTIAGLPPDLTKPLQGCAFAPRCPDKKEDVCSVGDQPDLVEAAPEHWLQNCAGCVAGSIND